MPDDLMRTMPDSCYVFIHAEPGTRVGLVRQGICGWLPTRIDDPNLSDQDARCIVDVLNGTRGITPTMADRMLLLAANGWPPARSMVRR